MQLSATHTGPMPGRTDTQRRLNDLAMSMTRSDAQLTDAVRNRNRIGAGWDDWFEQTARTLLDVRDQYGMLNPTDNELFQQLGQDALDLSSSSGTLLSAYKAGRTFGSGWDTTLDRKIEHVRLAADRLYDVPNPGTGGVTDAARAARDLVSRSLDVIRSIPADDRGSSATKQARLDAFGFNKQAQELLEPHFGTNDPQLQSQLRTADAHLEDAAWQLAKKPSPDGRFNGVDIPGATRDTEAALDVLGELAAIGG